MNPESFRNKDAYTVVQERVQEILEHLVLEFAKKWSVKPAELKAYAVSTPLSDIQASKINAEMGDYRAFKEAGGSGTKLAYLKGLRQAVAEFVSKEVKPLLKV